MFDHPKIMPAEQILLYALICPFGDADYTMWKYNRKGSIFGGKITGPKGADFPRGKLR
jgi:hypothetical protein